MSLLPSNAAPGLAWLTDTRMFISLVRCFFQCPDMAKSTGAAKTNILPKLLFQQELRDVIPHNDDLLLQL